MKIEVVIVDQELYGQKIASVDVGGLAVGDGYRIEGAMSVVLKSGQIQPSFGLHEPEEYRSCYGFDLKIVSPSA